MGDHPAAAPPSYPHGWASDVVLSDGGTVHVRPIRPDDGPALVAFHSRLSPETQYLRFFSPKPTLTERDVERFTVVDYRDRLAFVAVLGDDLVAVGRYDRVPGTDEAEVAFVVDDAHQGRGIGTVLIEYLADAAREQGISRFVADTLPHNRRMLEVFHTAGFVDERTLESGVVRVAFPIRSTPASRAAMHERERRAGVRSVAALLRPQSVAVVGAGRDPQNIGHVILRTVLAGGFTGTVYPVNAEAPNVAGVRAYPSVVDIPDPVDLAVIAVPAQAVPAVVEQCARKRVRGLVVVSAGFAERGPDGLAAERDLVERARRSGMRVVGPNCMGVLNTDPEVRLNATFAPVPLVAGRVAFSSQSGALGVAILERAKALGLGLSSFVSVGNKADVSSNDLLNYWEHDPRTDVVLLYLESFGNPRTFSRVARRVSRTKPIVAVRGGRTRAALRAVEAHSASPAAREMAADALFRQTGVIRVDTLEQLFDVARVLVHQPLPRGPRVAIVGNAGGPGVIAADTCEENGLEVPELAAATQAELLSFLPDPAHVANPVDMAGSTSAAEFERAVRVVLADPNVDAVLAIFIPPLVTRAEDVAHGIAAAALDSPDKPVLANFLAMHGMPEMLRGARADRAVPSFAFPESAVMALAAVHGYADWRRRPQGEVPPLDGIDATRGRAVVETALAESSRGCVLEAGAAAALLAAYGVTVRDRPPPRRRGAVDVVVGVEQDPSFGPLLTFGLGGSAARLLGDRAIRVLPLTDVDAAELVRAPRLSPMLFGHEGAPPVDVDGLEQLLLRVARLVEDLPEVVELTIDPVTVSPDRVVAVSPSVRLEPWAPRPELALRGLRY